MRRALSIVLVWVAHAGCAGTMRAGGDEVTGTGQYREPPPPPPPPPVTERPLALLGRRVQIVVPLGWRLTREEYTPRSALVEMNVPRGRAGGIDTGAAIRLRAELSTDETTFQIEADAHRAAIVADTADDPDWRTVVSTDTGDPPHVLIERTGRARGARVHLRVDLPLATDAARFIDRMVSELNAAMATLTIDGKTTFASPVSIAPR